MDMPRAKQGLGCCAQHPSDMHDVERQSISVGSPKGSVLSIPNHSTPSVVYFQSRFDFPFRQVPFAFHQRRRISSGKPATVELPFRVF
jgi:hypothetical protein